MANGLQPFYLLQSAFTSGEISSEVANRVDLDKYQYSVLQAGNCLVKPYGPIYKRPGLKYIARTKYSDKKSILVAFNGSDDKDYLLNIGEKYIEVFKNGEKLNVEIVTPYLESDLVHLRFTQSADTMFIASGKYPVKQLARYSDVDWRFDDFEITNMYFDETLAPVTSYEDNNTITPSALNGEVTLTAKNNTFTANSVGSSVMLKQEIPAKEVSVSNGTSDAIKVGENWKVISHGTWTGSFEVQKSKDGNTWETYRKYTSKNDYNPSESGSVTEPVFLRTLCNITSGTCNVNLTAMPYTHEGVAKITEVISEKQVMALVTEDFGSTKATDDYLFGAWSEDFGYPQTVCFFQDRLCFGGTKKQPYMVWMSRTGDYGNFSVEKASGTVTDDSAVAVAFVSRKQFKILHMVAGTDLMILTAGNEWTISGNETVTPTKCVPKMQTTRGCNNCEPLMIGGRIVFVQGRGSTVRDMGYSFETDSYGGTDLTLLAKHLIEGVDIVDSDYKQEPDSTIYFVRNDGEMLCLAYILEQKVYAWSRIATKGRIESVVSIQEGDEDIIYVVVERTINGKNVRNIEFFYNNPSNSNNPDDYVMLDAAVVLENTQKEAAEEYILVPELAGETVDVVGDGRVYKNIVIDKEGGFTLPNPVKHAVVGLPYESVIELPNVEIRTGDGTMQGRYKQVSECVLRLKNSLGGIVGCDTNSMDMLSYDELSAVYNIRLFSGDKRMTLPIGGFNNEGRIVVKSNEPYPFNLLMAVRKVSFGG